jgi:hypothetical protein
MEYIPTVRVSAAIASDYSASLETLGYSATLDYEESSEIILGIGVKEKDSSGNVKSLGEITFSNPSFGGDETSRFSGGGRFYLGDTSDFNSFLSFYSVMDTIKSDGVELGIQTGLSFGAGMERAISEKAFLDVSINYLVPLTDAEYFSPDLGTILYTNIEGWSINVGAGVSF